MPALDRATLRKGKWTVSAAASVAVSKRGGVDSVLLSLSRATSKHSPPPPTPPHPTYSTKRKSTHRASSTISTRASWPCLKAPRCVLTWRKSSSGKCCVSPRREGRGCPRLPYPKRPTLPPHPTFWSPPRTSTHLRGAATCTQCLRVGGGGACLSIGG
jgi:hypothetical protein